MECLPAAPNPTASGQLHRRDDQDIGAFDAIFDKLFGEVDDILHSLLARRQPEVVGCYLNNSTWPGTLFLLRRVKELAPGVRTIVGGPGLFMGVTHPHAGDRLRPLQVGEGVVGIVARESDELLGYPLEFGHAFV